MILSFGESKANYGNGGAKLQKSSKNELNFLAQLDEARRIADDVL